MGTCVKDALFPTQNMDNFHFGNNVLAQYTGDLKFSQICNFQSKIDLLQKNHDKFIKPTEKKIQNLEI